MATIKKGLKKAQDGAVKKKTKKTPFQKYGEKYPEYASDTIRPYGGSMDGDMGFKKGQMKALDKAYDKTYSNYDKLFKRFDGDEGVRRPGMKTGGTVKKKMKNGGSLSGLKASNKRVGPVDPKGSFTKVQKKTLAGAKGKASLTKDKQLGATKMAKRGMKISKKK